MSRRFYFPTLSSLNPDDREASESTPTATLDGDQARHATQVMRFGVGDTIVLFDGQGQEATCEIIATAKRSLTVKLIQTHRRSPVLNHALTLAVGLPKGDRQKVLIEKLVELGVTHFIPLSTRRGVADVTPKVIQRLEKQVVEASKQCERPWLMRIHPCMDLTAVQSWASSSGRPAHSLKIGCARASSHADGSAPDPGCESESDPSDVVIAIGPEGGFTTEELDLAAKLGFSAFTIGETVLRVETAAITAAVLFGAGRNFSTNTAD